VNKDRIEELITFVVQTTSVSRTRLMKFVYLADLAYAEAHEGATYTGADWQFLHFGPWSAAVNDAIEPTMAKIGATLVAYEHEEHGEQTYWHAQDSKHAKVQPNVVTQMAVERALKSYPSTPELLHRVYKTRPMLNAAPGAPLDFTTAIPSPRPSFAPEAPLTPRQAKALRAAKAEVQAKIAALRTTRPRKRVKVAPEYDADYFLVEELVRDSMGPEIEPGETDVAFDSSLWKSGARGEEIP
jgi:hypothetical protein